MAVRAKGWVSATGGVRGVGVDTLGMCPVGVGLTLSRGRVTAAGPYALCVSVTGGRVSASAHALTQWKVGAGMTVADVKGWVSAPGCMCGVGTAAAHACTRSESRT